MALEIERKFKMQGFPEDLKCLREVTIHQGYVSVEPEIRIHTATDRRTGITNYRLTMKGEGSLTRTEIYTSIEESFYRETVELMGLPMIEKDYRSYELGNHILEVCLVDSGTDHAFYYGEIEFDSEKEAHGFEKIPCLGEEVTENPDYKMKNYWKQTRLDNKN